MKNIQQSIETIPPSRVALVDNNRQYSYKALQELRLSNMDTICILKGSSVVINGRPRLEFALLLSMLDGQVENILFLPQDIEGALHEQYYQEATIHYEVYLENNILQYHTIHSPYKTSENTFHETKWIIPTSGTTNIPKLVSHTFQSLTKSTKSNIELGGTFRWGLVFDIYRFSGIQVFLQSLLAGSTLIITDAEQSMNQMLGLLVEKRCNALSATPSFWRKVLMTKEASSLQIQRVTLGGEIADSNILQALKQKYPHAKISHIYASTEVGVGFSVTDGEEGFPGEYLDGGIENIRMKIDQDGLLWISPLDKGQQYVSQGRMYDSDGYINTGDLVEERGGRIYFLGRDSGAINVGGNKVQPEEVERILLESDIINAAYVYAIKNPMMGSLVCADIVLKDESTDKKEAKLHILHYCREHLEGYKVPAILKFVQELQTTQSGKLKRKNR